MSAELVKAEPSGILAIIDRAARDESFDVAKLAALIELHERVTAKEAERQFNEAMTSAQSEMVRVAADAYNPQTKSKYASYAALDRALRPIYTKHGFGLSFSTVDTGTELEIGVVCKVSHTGGHSRDYRIDMPTDGKGAKGGDVMTRTHATGSGTSYGMRYLVKMIFNVAVGEDDDDGRRAGKDRSDEPQAPEGFAAWFAGLEVFASDGTAALAAAWESSRAEFKKHAAKHRLSEWNAMKATAAAVGRG